MKTLGFKSKNILVLLLLLVVTVSLDVAIGQVFFSAGPGVAFIAPAFMNLEKTDDCNMAGVATIAYVIRLSDIVTFPTLAETPSTPADLVKYIGNFILKDGKVWTTLYSTKEMGELLGEIDGPTDGKFFRNKATFFHPRTSANALGMMTMFKNSDVVVILKEFSGDGQLRVIGNRDIPATIFGSENSGKAFSDEKGITFEVEAASCKPALIYSGDIVTEILPPFTYIETNLAGSLSDHIDSYETITGWDNIAYPVIYLKRKKTEHPNLLFAYHSTDDMSVNESTGRLFSVQYSAEGVLGQVLELNNSGFGGQMSFLDSAPDGSTASVEKVTV